MDLQGIELAKILLKRREDGIKEEHDFEFLRKDGNRIYTRLEASPILEKDGTYIGSIACVTDITAQRYAEEEIRKSEEKFRSLFNSANDAISITDLEGHFLEVNAVAVERLGYSREEFLRMSVNDIVAPDYVNLLPQRIIELSKRGYAIFETAHRRRDGATIPVELSNRIIDYAGQKAILSISRDISERKRFENIENQFISIASHELRTPIAALSQSISNLQKYYENLTVEQRIRLIDSIFRNTNLLTELANDLILISQLKERKLKLNWIPYSPYNILQEVLDQLEQKRVAKEIEIEVEFDLNIQLFGDPQKVGQIFRIFLDNSLKYSANNTNIQIKTIDHYQGQYNSRNIDGLLIQFTDYGRGIRPEDLPYLFTRFFRSEEVRDIPGTGLGLSIALNLTQIHQGEIHVESTYGTSTTIFLFLPRLRKIPPI
jgi:PAS domain S-box-containing protein